MSIALKDTLTPALRKAAAGIENKMPILEAMGLQLESLTRRAFNEPNLRPAPWVNKLTVDANGHFSRSTPSNLRKNQVLVRSIHISALTNSSVTVATDRIYGAIHQMGGIIRPKNKPLLSFSIGGHHILAKKVTMPARPFFPFLGGKMTPTAQTKIAAIGMAKIAALFKA